MRADLRKKIAAGIAAAAMIVGGLFCLGDGELANRFFLYSGAPFYVSAGKTEGGKAESGNVKQETGEDAAAPVFNSADDGRVLIPDGASLVMGGANRQKAAETPDESDAPVYQPDHDGLSFHDTSAPLPYSAEQLRDFDFLRKNFYTINPDTDLLASDIDIDAALTADFRLSPISSPAPKVLIFHTHMYESFAGSDETDYTQGVYAAGERLAADLRARGISVMHVGERFDMADGAVSVFGAYERMEPVIKKILAENPSIEMCIDLHRDGVTTTEPAVAVVNGRRAARVMLFNGMSRIKDKDKLNPIAGLDNPNLKANLAFSLMLLMTSESLYPGFAKKIFLKPYRYSLHMLPKSVLVEIGNQNNTLDEAVYAMDLLADVIYSVVGD